MTASAAIAALLEAWTACGYDPVMAPLAFPHYAFRELRPQQLADGAVSLTVSKWGFGYKHRCRRPKSPPPVDTRGVRKLLTPHLPSGVTIRSVTDEGGEIKVILEMMR